jgi:hypothetical protein
VFHVRSIFPDADRVDAESFELHPTNPQGEAVCSLFEKFFENRPPAFRDKLSFLKRGDFDLDWSTAPGGVALASFFQGREPVCMGVLLSGVDRSTDEMMLEVFRENVLIPLFEGAFDEATQVSERPLVVQVMFPGSPEWGPALHLLSTALASVYFRAVLKECAPQ